MGSTPVALAGKITSLIGTLAAQIIFEDTYEDIV